MNRLFSLPDASRPVTKRSLLHFYNTEDFRRRCARFHFRAASPAALAKLVQRFRVPARLANFQLKGKHERRSPLT
jgi:hypothetical protein